MCYLFSDVDEYDDIRQYMRQYVETGKAITPTAERGRGLRVPKPNSRYEPEDRDEELSSPVNRQV